MRATRKVRSAAIGNFGDFKVFPHSSLFANQSQACDALPTFCLSLCSILSLTHPQPSIPEKIHPLIFFCPRQSQRAFRFQRDREANRPRQTDPGKPTRRTRGWRAHNKARERSTCADPTTKMTRGAESTSSAAKRAKKDKEDPLVRRREELILGCRRKVPSPRENIKKANILLHQKFDHYTVMGEAVSGGRVRGAGRKGQVPGQGDRTQRRVRMTALDVLSRRVLSLISRRTTTSLDPFDLSRARSPRFGRLCPTD